ncbi:MAG: 3-hydroxyacyl-CoA dehydrogenase NAD-binding domain-containing protein [Ornithinimicrobium sp.]
MEIFSVAVIGTGTMGAGIAQVAASAGHDVYLVDRDEGAAYSAIESIALRFDRLVVKGQMTGADAAAAAGRLHVSGGDPARLPAVGLVIEAAAENMAVKHDILGALDHSQPADAIIASNTSSLDISQLAAGISHPGRVIGLHFFNPPPLMRLVEVIRGENSAPDVLDNASDLMHAWGKTPVRCASTPGFIVNRVARPFYGEAQRMVADDIIDPASLDAALREHGGFAMGPMELTDLIGQDINLAVGTSVWEQTGRDPRYEPTAYHQDLVGQGRLGRKTGRGVYTYDSQGKAIDARPDPDVIDALVGGDPVIDPVARTIAMIVNEAVDLHHRGEASADDIDTAMRLGANYPQGPFQWLDQLGASHVAQVLAALDHAYPGGRYRPSPGLS